MGLARHDTTRQMKHIGKSAAEAKDLIAQIDDNGDGVISKEEFATALEVNRLGHNRNEIKGRLDARRSTLDARRSTLTCGW